MKWQSLANKRIELLILFAIFLLACILRFYRLDAFPVGFHIDEAIIGDTAYSILKTGKDYDGRYLPHSIEVFKDYIPAGYHYLAIIPVWLFGLSEFATRFPGALFGALTIFPVYFLALYFFQRKSVALLSALLIAIAPWHIIFSRSSSETLVSLFFIISGFSFLLYELENRRNIYLIPATLLLSLSFFFYHASRLFVPLFFAALLALYMWGDIRRKLSHYRLSLLSFLLISVLSFALVFIVGGGTNRFNQTSIFSAPETRLVMEEQIREDGVLAVPANIARIFHNKVVSYGLTFTANYLEYFSGNFLFIEGGKPIIFSIPNLGLLYIVLLPFMLFGMIKLVQEKDRRHAVLFVWILLSPIVASLTADDVPNTRRAIMLFSGLELVAAFGIISAIYSVKKKFRIVGIAFVVVCVVFNFSYFLHQYFVHARIHRTWERNNGFKTLVATMNTKFKDYDAIIVTRSKGGIWPLIVFYSQYDPAKYQAEGSPRDTSYKGFDRYFFAPAVCPSLVRDVKYPKTGKILYVEHGEDCKKTPQGKTVEYIYREDGTKAFRLVY